MSSHGTNSDQGLEHVGKSSERRKDEPMDDMQYAFRNDGSTANEKDVPKIRFVPGDEYVQVDRHNCDAGVTGETWPERGGIAYTSSTRLWPKDHGPSHSRERTRHPQTDKQTNKRKRRVMFVIAIVVAIVLSIPFIVIYVFDKDAETTVVTATRSSKYGQISVVAADTPGPTSTTTQPTTTTTQPTTTTTQPTTTTTQPTTTTTTQPTTPYIPPAISMDGSVTRPHDDLHVECQVLFAPSGWTELRINSTDDASILAVGFSDGTTQQDTRNISLRLVFPNTMTHCSARGEYICTLLQNGNEVLNTTAAVIITDDASNVGVFGNTRHKAGDRYDINCTATLATEGGDLHLYIKAANSTDLVRSNVTPVVTIGDEDDACYRMITKTYRFIAENSQNGTELRCVATNKFLVSNQSSDPVEIDIKLAGCDSKIDLIFLLDGSGSIGYIHFQTMKGFIQNFTESVTIGKNALRIGVVKFSVNARYVFWLNAYDSRDSIITAVANISYDRGRRTHIKKALRYVRDNAFTTPNGARLNATRVIVLMADGQSNDIPDSVAANLRNEGVLVVSIGIGNRVEVEQLNSTAYNPTFFFHVTRFSDLIGIKDNVVSSLCDFTNDRKKR